MAANLSTTDVNKNVPIFAVKTTRCQENILSINKVIWVTSYPKSGNTWVHQILKQMATKYGFPVTANMDVYKLLSSKESAVAFPNVIGAKNNETAVLKTHHELSEEDLFPELGLETVGSVYIRRNPLDVLLSYINFSKLQMERVTRKPALQKRFFIDLMGYDDIVPINDWKKSTLDNIGQAKLDYALDFFRDHDMYIPTYPEFGTWISHNKSWGTAIPPRITLRYEDCIEDRKAFLALLELFDFTEEELFNSVDTRNIATENARTSPDGNNPNRIFYNKMESYYYTRYFSKAAVSRFINAHGRILNEFGYSDLPS